MIKRILAAGSLLLAGLAAADQAGPPTSSRVDATAALAFRNAGAAEHGNYWRLPGTLMGGMAEPAGKGAVIDDAQLSGALVMPGRSYTFAKLAWHEGHEGVELETLSFMKSFDSGPGDISLSAGKRDGAFSPLASWHSSSSAFSEASLAGDIFLGRSYTDTGIAFEIRQEDIRFGAELWNGDAWPATSGEGAGDVYLYFSGNSGGGHFSLGGWVMRASASLRGDDRYTQGHNHNTVFAPALVDVRFSGDSSLYGMSLSVERVLGDKFSLLFDGEWVSVDIDGDVRDDTRILWLESKQAGWYIQPAIRSGDHLFSVRYEKLSFKNDVTGPSPVFLATDANIVNNGFNPARTSASWQWKLSRQFRTRAEWIDDRSMPVDEERVVLGLVWSYSLWVDGETGYSGHH